MLNSLDKRIAMFVQKTLSVDYDEAQRKRKDYWSKYGTTLAGLRNLYGVQPNEFFRLHSRAVDARVPQGIAAQT